MTLLLKAPQTPLRLTACLTVLLALLPLAACGGGSGTNTYDSLREQAAAQETKSRQLGVESPCNSAAQCGMLSFQATVPTCNGTTYKAYSLVSATATLAEAAATEQRRLASEALKLAPNNQLACPAIYHFPPVPACSSKVCSLGQ